MDTIINLDQLASTQLQYFNEIWLSTSDRPDAEDAAHSSLCLWRGEQVFTHDMLSEGTHDQNTRLLWLKLDTLDDQAAIASVEATIRQYSQTSGMQGEFYPAQRVDSQRDD